MPYRYLDDIATADAAFEVWGETLETLFRAAADALLGIMIDAPESVLPACSEQLALKDEELDLLLFTFLQELVFLKDARQLLLRVPEMMISESEGVWQLTATARGERIDAGRHRLGVDVKAITLHHFTLHRHDDRWLATVVVDI